MINIILYILASVIVVSAISLIGIVTIFFNIKNLNKIALYFVSISVGALLGDVFIHLLPESFETGKALTVGLFVLAGMLFSFVMEKFIHWRHCHEPETHDHHHSFTYMNLIGESMHNFIDGLVIAGAYYVSIPVGIATTAAVIMHEIPHELGNFGVLIHGGFKRSKALLYNFFTALTAILGAILGILLSSTESLFAFLVPFAAGNLLYIAASDLIPELHKHSDEDFRISESLMQLVLIILGISVMILLVFLE